MRNTLKPLIFVVISLLLSAFTISFVSHEALASDYTTNYKRTPAVQNLPAKVAQWGKAPVIILCEYAPVSKTQVYSAIAFWERLGYKFLYSQKPDAHLQCSEKQPAGYITIHLVTMGAPIPPASLAETHFYVNNNTKEIEWATIYLRADVKKTVLEHEFGHALGFLHFDRINHLMNEMWEMGGWDTDGLERKQQ